MPTRFDVAVKRVIVRERFAQNLNKLCLPWPSGTLLTHLAEFCRF